jgi:Cellulose biosynthesis protein BcsS
MIIQISGKSPLLFGLLLGASVGAFPAQATAQSLPVDDQVYDGDVGVVYAGGTVSRGISGYVGGIVALPGSRLGSGFAVRGTVSAGAFDYDASMVRINADYRSAELAIVYQQSGQWGRAAASVGPRYTNLKLSPGDPTNARAGDSWDVAVGTDGQLGKYDSFQLGWLGSYGIRDNSYFARLDATYPVIASVRLGVEGIAQGDDSYAQTNLGGLVRSTFGKYSVSVSAGVSRQAELKDAGYATLGLSKAF